MALIGLFFLDFLDFFWFIFVIFRFKTEKFNFEIL